MRTLQSGKPRFSKLSVKQLHRTKVNYELLEPICCNGPPYISRGNPVPGPQSHCKFYLNNDLDLKKRWQSAGHLKSLRPSSDSEKIFVERVQSDGPFQNQIDSICPQSAFLL